MGKEKNYVESGRKEMGEERRGERGERWRRNGEQTEERG